MQAIQFNTKINGASLKIPAIFKNLLNRNATVIVLYDEDKAEGPESARVKKAKAIAKSIPLSDIDPDANPELLFGIWKDRNITLEELRNRAWGGRQ